MNSKLYLLAPLLTLACYTGADDGRAAYRTTTSGPDAQQAPSTSVSGPDFSQVRLGPRDTRGSRDAGFAPGNAPGVRNGTSAPRDDYDDCIDSCEDEGYSSDECRSFCGGPVSGGDGDGDTGTPGSCADLDVCLRCLCEQGETADYDACVPPCDPL